MEVLFFIIADASISMGPSHFSTLQRSLTLLTTINLPVLAAVVIHNVCLYVLLRVARVHLSQLATANCFFSDSWVENLPFAAYFRIQYMYLHQ